MGAAPEVIGIAAAEARARLGRRLVGIGIGAAVVALAAQVAVPVPFSPVPMTLQPLAVLAVGGLLGGVGGAAALATYLALGVLGLPVFAGGSSGVLHLLGPTGGYLLAFPVAAALTGGALLFYRHWLGGVTGDLLGAATELTETALLLAAAALA